MRFLIVGLGAAGQRHARNLRTLLGEEVELVAVRRLGGGLELSDTLQPASATLPEDALSIRVVPDLRAALTERLDGVIVADPTSLHVATASAALAANCAILIEKPLGGSWEGVPEFLAAAQQHPAPVLIGYQMRFHPLVERLRTLVSDGTLGRVLSAACTYGEYLPDWHPYEDYRRSYAARRDLGGGVLLTQIHDIDNLGWLLGWPSHVYSVGGHLSRLEIDVEDTATTVWTSRSGDRAVPVRLHQDYLRRPAMRRIELVLDEGSVELDLLSSRLRVWNKGSQVCLDDQPAGWHRNDAFLAEMRHFLACIEEGATPRIPPSEAARSLAVALAALRSQTSGMVEEVDYAGESDGAATTHETAFG